ncbi:MAG: nitronate monooxygenase [Polyangiales bacterium]
MTKKTSERKRKASTSGTSAVRGTPTNEEATKQGAGEAPVARKSVDHDTTMTAVRDVLSRASAAKPNNPLVGVRSGGELGRVGARVPTAKTVATAAVEKAHAHTSSESKQRETRVESQDAPSKRKTPTMNPNDPLHTRACDLFGVRYPIVQTGMGWVSGARLTAATSEAGGLGILAAATMTFEELRSAIHKVKERTSNNFGVNLRADQADVHQRCDLLIAEKVKVASFAQAPKKDVIQKLKDAGLVVMPTVGARRHAEKVQEWGVDAIIAQGHEGGGHTGAVPTSLLISQCADAVDIPVIGAGGFSDGRGLVAALAYGASGIAMGTRFLLTQESQVPEHVKAVYLKTDVTGTVVTKAVDGYPQRVIRTPMIDELERSNPLLRFPLAARNALALMKITKTNLADMLEEGMAMKQNKELTWSQLAMAANAPMLTKATMVDGKIQAGILPTGQVVGVIDELPTVSELVNRIMDEARAVVRAFGA